MFSVREIYVAANGLGNLLKAQSDLGFACRRMMLIQPDRADFWADVGKQVEYGKPLSSQLEKVWPEDCVQPLKVGEKAGDLSAILWDIRDACEYSEEVRGQLMGLLQPVIYILMAVTIGLGFVGFVLPMIGSVFSANGKSVVGEWGDIVNKLLLAFWPVLLIGALGTLGYIVYWLQRAENRLTLVGWSLSVPLIGAGLSSLIFSKWSRFMAVMFTAGGVDLWDMFRLTAPILPERLRSPLLLAASALQRGESMQKVFGENTNIYREVNVKLIPQPILVAFLLGGESGNLDEQLRIASKTLDKDGKKQLELGIKATQAIATVTAGVCAIIPMALYVVQMLSSLADSGKVL
jgi:type II secretory pathway component PulF